MRTRGNSQIKRIVAVVIVLLAVLLLGLAARSAVAVQGERSESGCEMRIDLPVQQCDQPGLDELFLNGVPVNRYFLLLEGELLAVADDPYDLAGLVMSAARRYVDDETVYCSLADPKQVQICYGKVSALSNADFDSAREQLQERLQVMTVVQNRTLEIVPFDRVMVKDASRDASLPAEVTTPGKDGVREIITSTSFLNGSLDGVEMSEEVLEEPVTQIESVGTRVELPPEPEVQEQTSEYIWPAEGRISSRFGYRKIAVGSTYHKGIDIAVNTGTDVKAAKDGTVIYSGWESGYGYLVKLEHEDGDITYYGHNSSLLVSVGDQVSQGDVIARSGNTGRSTGPHLHFEIRLNGAAVDPLDYLP